MKKQYRRGKTSLIGTFGIGGLSAYLAGVVHGYIQGFTWEHKAVRRVGGLLVPVAALALVFFIIHLAAPILPQIKQEAEIEASVAQAAEDEKEINLTDGEETEAKSTELPPKAENIEEKETESQAETVPLDDSILEPSDVYAEKDSMAVFQAYHPGALSYQWEIGTESGQWEDASPWVTERTDELQRKISSLELTADKEKTVRCRISVEQDSDITYAADLHVLSTPINSISVDGFSAEAGKYVKAGEIPVEVTYQDGTQEVITGLSGLHFLDTEESKESSETEAGNLKETITTIKTASAYNHLQAGKTEAVLCYRKTDGEALETPVNMEGIDLTAPMIDELRISEFEVSKVDQPVPVTVTICAEDDVTPIRQLMYAFLPEGEEVQEDDWMKEPAFTAEITKNGIWTAYCRDKAGNIATTGQELIVVDSKAPVISLSLQNKKEWCKENTIYVSAEDSLQVEYRYICSASGEDSGWIKESSKKVSFNGTWAIQVRDAVGNTAEQEITVDNIDTRAPVIRSITEKTEGEAVKNEE